MSLSAAVTRILTLSGFPPELKTRDIQAAFGEWENERGGFKIKWVDDTTLMLVFQDAVTAKRAYLSTLLQPPAQLVNSASGSNRRIIVKPYDGLDAQAIIQNVNSRTNPTRGGHASRQSVSVTSGGVALGGAHKRGASYASAAGSFGRAGGLDVAAANASTGNREPSPTLPNLPTHPSLNALISSGLNDLTPPGHSKEGSSYVDGASGGAAPKVGDPAKRMVGHALGIRHPGVANTRPDTVKELEKGMAGVAITAE
ncbi:hypothetical protein FRB90_002563 [Tulasnella sp. 427]|nr:hypothetical protein FRB90_002563 [Tulasnella sp. 427]